MSLDSGVPTTHGTRYLFIQKLFIAFSQNWAWSIEWIKQLVMNGFFYNAKELFAELKGENALLRKWSMKSLGGFSMTLHSSDSMREFNSLSENIICLLWRVTSDFHSRRRPSGKIEKVEHEIGNFINFSYLQIGLVRWHNIILFACFQIFIRDHLLGEITWRLYSFPCRCLLGCCWSWIE